MKRQRRSASTLLLHPIARCACDAHRHIAPSPDARGAGRRRRRRRRAEHRRGAPVATLWAAIEAADRAARLAPRRCNAMRRRFHRITHPPSRRHRRRRMRLTRGRARLRDRRGARSRRAAAASSSVHCHRTESRHDGDPRRLRCRRRCATALARACGALTAIVGTKCFDDVPQGTPLPYVAFGDIETRDWSTKDARGCEHS